MNPNSPSSRPPGSASRDAGIQCAPAEGGGLRFKSEQRFIQINPLAPDGDDVVQDLTTLPLRLMQESELMALKELVPDQLYKLASSYSLEAFHSLRDRMAELPLAIHRMELCQGEVFVSAAPSRDHQVVVSNFLISMTLFARRNQLGNVFPTLSLNLDRQNYLEPDLLFATQEELERCTEQGMVGPVSWVIEALSPSTRTYDRKEKRRSYLEHGVQYYWTVDVRNKHVDIFTDPIVNRYERIKDPQALLTCPALPGWSMKLKDVFDPGWIMVDTEAMEASDTLRAKIQADEAKLVEAQTMRELATVQAALARTQVRREKRHRLYFQERARAAVEHARASLEAHLRAQSEAEALKKDQARIAEQLLEAQRQVEQVQRAGVLELLSVQVRVETAEAQSNLYKGRAAEGVKRVQAERELRELAEIDRHKANAQAWLDREARTQAEARILTEREARTQAEARILAERESRTQAEARILAERESLECAETQIKAEREARRAARAQVRAERDARRQAEAQAIAEQDARRQAEAQAIAEQDARRQAEAQAAHIRSVARSITQVLQEASAAQQRLDALLQQPQVLPGQLEAAAAQLRQAQARALEASAALVSPSMD